MTNTNNPNGAALAVQQQAINMDIQTLGRVLVESRFFSDTRSAAQAVVKVLAGRELNIGPIASMTGINIIKGKVALSANLMAAQVKKSMKYDYRVARLDDTACELVFFEMMVGNKREEIGRSSFTIEDARRAGLASNDNYKKFTRNMLFSRALSNGVRWFCPDVMNGNPVYTFEEASSMDFEVVEPGLPQTADEARDAFFTAYSPWVGDTWESVAVWVKEQSGEDLVAPESVAGWATLATIVRGIIESQAQPVEGEAVVE